MRIHCLIHASFEEAGYFATWAASKGFAMAYTHSYRDEPLPTCDDFDFLLIMGGPQSPLQTKEYPYLSTEMQLIHQAIELDKYVVGVCLGAQLISQSLGADTEKSPHKEIGFFPIQLTAAGLRDPNLQGVTESLLVAHWHGDMPGLPAGCEVLAQSEGCPRQIIKYNQRVYGLQCHMELTPASVAALIENCPEDLEAGKYVETATAMLEQDYATGQQYLDIFLENLIR